METETVDCVVCGGGESEVVARGRDYIYAGSADYLAHVACRSCGHIYLNPRPTPAALPVMYPPHYGTFAKKFQGSLNPLGRVKLAVNMRRFRKVAGELPKGAKVLDVGCGDGDLLRAIAEARPDVEATGLDWHFPAATREALEGRRLRLIEAPLESAELPRGHFDLILMNQLVEHLWQPRDCLANLLTALKPGGRLVIETPDTDGYDRRWFAGGTWGGYYVPRHLNLFDMPRLARLLGETGFEVARQAHLPAPVIWCYSLQGALRERFGQGTPWARLFEPKNLPLLAGFAALDMAATALGLATSNQQTVARRPA
jgi:SAM-dependent methyltransferase